MDLWCCSNYCDALNSNCWTTATTLMNTCNSNLSINLMMSFVWCCRLRPHFWIAIHVFVHDLVLFHFISLHYRFDACLLTNWSRLRPMIDTLHDFGSFYFLFFSFHFLTFPFIHQSIDWSFDRWTKLALDLQSNNLGYLRSTIIKCRFESASSRRLVSHDSPNHIRSLISRFISFRKINDSTESNDPPLVIGISLTSHCLDSFSLNDQM